MKMIRSIGIVILFITGNLVAQWNIIYGLPGGGNCMDAVDRHTAVVISAGEVCVTYNWGENWQCNPILNPIDSTDNLSITDVSMTDSLSIWCCTNYPAMIMASLDGGLTWTQQYFDSSRIVIFHYIEMFNELEGVAMGEAYDETNLPVTVLWTEDGGLHWQPMNQSPPGSMADSWQRVDFVSTHYGFVFTVYDYTEEELYKTSDRGGSWSSLGFNPEAIHLVKLYNEDIALVLVHDRLMLTVDGGLSWRSFDITDHWWGDIEFAPEDPSRVWMTGSGGTYASQDTGKTWVRQPQNPGALDIVMIDQNIGWKVGSVAVYRTINGGMPASGIETPQQTPEHFSLKQNYPNPFNPKTTISFSLPAATFVNLDIFDITGVKVTSLCNEVLFAGTHRFSWSGGDQKGRAVKSGVYFARVQTDQNTETIRMHLLK